MAEGRESIWSVSEGERRWYSALFPIVLLISVLYYAIYVISWDEGTSKGVGALMIRFGALGVSSAILSMILVAGGRTMVISVEWLREKVNANREARESAREAMRQEWIEEGRRLEREEQRKKEAQRKDAEDKLRT